MEGLATFRTPNGNSVQMYTRDGTSDRAIVETIILGNEYKIPTHYVGVGVDVGAHVGAWAIAAVADNPGLVVIAIEAVLENVQLMRRNVKLNDMEKRIKVLHRAASSSNHDVPIHYGWDEEGYVRDNRFVGNIQDGGEIQMVQGLRLTRLARLAKEPIRIMKIDCEGCEWKFLKSAAINKVQEIVGEWHSAEPEAIQELLGPTHNVEILTNPGGIGLFRATLR